LRVRKAIIPAAGLGTRFLPPQKRSPKKCFLLLTSYNQYIVEEAIKSGIEDIIIIREEAKER